MVNREHRYIDTADPSWYKRVLRTLDRDFPEISDKVWDDAIGENAVEQVEKTRRAAGLEPRTVEPGQGGATGCAKCRLPFDPADQRFDGAARYQDTAYCRRCVNHCHDSEIADHRCVICAGPGER